MTHGPIPEAALNAGLEVLAKKLAQPGKRVVFSPAAYPPEALANFERGALRVLRRRYPDGHWRMVMPDAEAFAAAESVSLDQPRAWRKDTPC